MLKGFLFRVQSSFTKAVGLFCRETPLKDLGVCPLTVSMKGHNNLTGRDIRYQREKSHDNLTRREIIKTLNTEASSGGFTLYCRKFERELILLVSTQPTASRLTREGL